MRLTKFATIIAAALIGFGSVTAASAATPPGIPAGWSDGFVYANGARLHYYHAVPQPGKPVIVMAHGVTDNGLSWTTLTEDLQKNYDIYMTDARGHGLSDPFNDSNGGDTLIKDLVGFVQAMRFTKPILIGHSMGAATVMRVGAEYPDLPRAVIMLDPLLGRLPPALATAVRPPAATAAPRARRPGDMNMFGSPEDLVAQNNDSFDNFVAACGRQNPKWDPVDCQYWALSKKQYHGTYTEAQRQSVMGTMSLADALARITAPALILKADAPPEVREANAKAASVMKNGKLIHVDNAAHNLHHDQRAKTVELLTEFLSKL
jgi:pimeloyl-ACP methyl ester carboxylesterase